MLCRLFAPLALIIVTACTADGGDRFPSLLPRAIESRGDTETTIEQPPVVQQDPSLDSALGELRSRLNRGKTAFDTAFMRADRLANAARGARAGSDAWLDAQVALAELDVIRTDTRLQIAEMERLAIDRALTLAPAYPALDALLAEAQAQDAESGDRITMIETRLDPA